MNNKPLVSIITVVFNGEKYLEETMINIQNQKYDNIEHIVIDANSTDGTIDIIKKYEKNIAYWVSEPDDGQTDALIKGFDRCNGDILYWLNYDDLLYDENTLIDIVEVFQNNKDVELVYGNDILVDKDLNIIKLRDFSFHSLGKLLYYKSISQPSSFFTRKVYEEFGLNKKLNYSMDLDLWLNGNVNPLGSCGTTPGSRIIPAAIPLLDGGVNYNVENGLDHILRITWVPGLPGTITVTLLDATGSTTYAIVSHSFDPMVVFGTNTPIYGFSGTTGGLNNAQSFCSPTILLNSRLMSFNAGLNNGNEVDLEWEAISENGGAYFVIERSRDGVFFEELTTLPAKVEAKKVNHYSTIDANPFAGYGYYRLMQVDGQGKSTYSTIKVIHNVMEEGMINLYPNPVEDRLNIAFLNKEKGAVLILYNNLGQAVVEQRLFSGNRTILDVSNLESGVYLLQIKNGDFTTKTFKIIKK